MTDNPRKRKRLSLSLKQSGVLRKCAESKYFKRSQTEICVKESGTDNTNKEESSLKYCPTCQFPFNNLKITPDVHCSLCSVDLDSLTECKDGERCCNASIFHYRDFAHKKLALSRCGADIQQHSHSNSDSKSTTFEVNTESLREDDDCLENFIINQDVDVKTVSLCNEKVTLNVNHEPSPEYFDQLNKSTEGQIVNIEIPNTNSVSTPTDIDTISKSELTPEDSSQCSVKFILKNDKDEYTEMQRSSQSSCKSSVGSLEAAALKIEAEFDSVLSDCYDTLRLKGAFDLQTVPAYENTESEISEKMPTEIREEQSDFKNQWNGLMTRMRSNASFENPVIVPQNFKSKICPFYKRIPDTTFVVDAFNYGIIPGVTVYFLSHFHSDHYGGLRKSFNQLIYCSSITASLVKLKIRVDEKYIRTINVNETRSIGGVLVTALDANHCPGSVMFLFQLSDGRNILHVGDFRADPIMESYSALYKLPVDILYLDTTYCEPRYTFPTQQEIIEEIVSVVKQHLKRFPQTLIVCGTYSVGKEKVFNAVAKAIDSKLWARTDKRKILECLQDETIRERLISEPCSALVHVYPMGGINFEDLALYFKTFSSKFTHILAVKPTGWEMKKNELVDIVTRGNITICGAPYSEHSSYTELERFVKFLKPSRIVPTVNVKNSAKLEKHFKKWLSETSPKSIKAQNTLVQTTLTKFLKSS